MKQEQKPPPDLRHASGQWTVGAPVGYQVTRYLASCEHCGRTNYHRGNCDGCGAPL